MNDRLHPSIALPRELLDEPFIWPRPDETSFSYFARVSTVFPEYPPKKIYQLIFGAQSSISIGVLHFGWGRFQEYLKRHGCDADAVWCFSLLPLYRPFAEEQNYADAVNAALTRHAGSLPPTRHSVTPPFRPAPAICPNCVVFDYKNYGFSWFRRTHQAASMRCCTIHGCTLLDACPSCGEKFSSRHLPALACRQCGAPLQAADTGAPAELATARIVQAIYEGRIPPAPTELRLATLRTRVSERVSNRSGIVGDNLARQLIRHFGRDLLHSLNWAPDSSPTFAWPMLLIHGLHFVNHPTPNILLITMLFDSAEDYTEALKAERVRGAPCPLNAPRPLIGACNITPAMLRAAYQHTIEGAAASAGGSDQRLRFWLRDYPGLSTRRKKFFARRQLPRDRKILEAYIRQNPHASRTTLYEIYYSHLRRIRITDPDWLDRTLPRKTKRGTPSKKPESV